MENRNTFKDITTMKEFWMVSQELKIENKRNMIVMKISRKQDMKHNDIIIYYAD